MTYPSFPAINRGLRFALILLPALRILDIVQAVVNLGVFDHLSFRVGDEQNQKTQTVANVTRSVVLLAWNFAELILWFGLLYMPLEIQQNGAAASFASRFYFSGITQLTIGYGDITPFGIARALAVIQGILAWLLTVIVLARFVSGLPRLEE